jgi:hypothetical protein
VAEEAEVVEGMGEAGVEGTMGAEEMDGGEGEEMVYFLFFCFSILQIRI